MPTLVLVIFNMYLSHIFITCFSLGWNAFFFQMMLGYVLFVMGYKAGRYFQRRVTSGEIQE